MKLQTTMFNEKKYDIIDDVLIKVKSSKKTYAQNNLFPVIEGNYRIIATYHRKNLESVVLFLPEFASQMYSADTVIEEPNLDYAKIILTSNNLKHPLNIKNKNLELFDNGFEIKNNYIKIHPAYFFDKVVGFYFNLID